MAPDGGMSVLVAAGSVSEGRVFRSPNVRVAEPATLESVEKAASIAVGVTSSGDGEVGTELVVAFSGGVRPVICLSLGAELVGLSVGSAEEKSFASGTLKFAGMANALFPAGGSFCSCCDAAKGNAAGAEAAFVWSAAVSFEIGTAVADGVAPKNSSDSTTFAVRTGEEPGSVSNGIKLEAFRQGLALSETGNDDGVSVGDSAGGMGGGVSGAGGRGTGSDGTGLALNGVEELFFA